MTVVTGKWASTIETGTNVNAINEEFNIISKHKEYNNA